MARPTACFGFDSKPRPWECLWNSFLSEGKVAWQDLQKAILINQMLTSLNINVPKI